MTDLKGIEISDVLGLSQPLTKLIETVSSGIGKIYEPTHIKRMAKAHNDELNLLSTTIKDNANMLIHYKNQSLSVENEALLHRAQNRFISQEIIKQQNIDNIIRYAAINLSKSDHVSDQQVDKTWVNRFFKSIDDISTEELQKIWGKVLAGEIKNPNSISLRVLDVLRNLSVKEAKLFEYICNLSLTAYNSIFLPNDMGLLDKFNISYKDIILLTQCDLLLGSDLNNLSVKFNNLSEDILYSNKNYAIVVKSKYKQMLEIKLSMFLLTYVGTELYNILKIESYDDLLLDYYFTFINQFKNDENIILSIHKLYEYDFANNIYKYDSTPIQL